MNGRPGSRQRAASSRCLLSLPSPPRAKILGVSLSALIVLSSGPLPWPGGVLCASPHTAALPGPARHSQWATLLPAGTQQLCDLNVMVWTKHQHTLSALIHMTISVTVSVTAMPPQELSRRLTLAMKEAHGKSVMGMKEKMKDLASALGLPPSAAGLGGGNNSGLPGM